MSPVSCFGWADFRFNYRCRQVEVARRIIIFLFLRILFSRFYGDTSVPLLVALLFYYIHIMVFRQSFGSQVYYHFGDLIIDPRLYMRREQSRTYQCINHCLRISIFINSIYILRTELMYMSHSIVYFLVR